MAPVSGGVPASPKAKASLPLPRRRRTEPPPCLSRSLPTGVPAALVLPARRVSPLRRGHRRDRSRGSGGLTVSINGTLGTAMSMPLDPLAVSSTTGTTTTLVSSRSFLAAFAPGGYVIGSATTHLPAGQLHRGEYFNAA